MKPLSKRAVWVLLAAFVLLLIGELALSNFTALTVGKQRGDRRERDPSGRVRKRPLL